MVPLQWEPQTTKARKARHDKTKRNQACLNLEPTYPNTMTKTRCRNFVVDVPHKFLRVRTRLLVAPDDLPRCLHWREPVPARYTPLTGWGPRQDSSTGRRLPDRLAGGVVGGLVSTATIHQARESQMEVKNVQRMYR
jgi:hypothetical protein